MSESEIDAAVLASAESSWKKVAMVISRAAKRLYGDLPDGEEKYMVIAKRIEALVEIGRLKAQGDITKWRHSEVRLI
jgi:hypothetical protein